MTGLLSELAVATGIAVAVLSTAAVVGHQRRAAHAKLLERAVAVEAAEGLLVHARGVAKPVGVHVVDLKGLLPEAARLPSASAQLEVHSLADGLAEIEATVRWASGGGTATVVRRTFVEYRR